MAEKKKPFKFPGEGPMPKKKPFKFKGEGSMPVHKPADDARKAETERTRMLRGETPEDKKFRTLMEKYKYDVTKIPGFKP